MDAIKKKMQAMKVEKDNAMDRSDACEQAAKDAKVRAAKAEEEVADLVKKSQQLEVELDKTKEELMTTTQKLEEKEKALLASELEVKIKSRHPKLPYILQFQPLLGRCPPSTEGSRVWRGTWRPARTSCCLPRRSSTR